MDDFARAYEYIRDSLDPKRIVVECPSGVLNEAAVRRIGRYTIRKDQPHTGGDEYHAHCQLGAYEVCWTDSGRRRYPNKFPADNKIPNDVKSGIANILGISVDMLECWQTEDSSGEDVYLVTICEGGSAGMDTHAPQI